MDYVVGALQAAREAARHRAGAAPDLERVQRGPLGHPVRGDAAAAAPDPQRPADLLLGDHQVGEALPARPAGRRRGPLRRELARHQRTADGAAVRRSRPGQDFRGRGAARRAARATRQPARRLQAHREVSARGRPEHAVDQRAELAAARAVRGVGRVADEPLRGPRAASAPGGRLLRLPGERVPDGRRPPRGPPLRHSRACLQEQVHLRGRAPAARPHLHPRPVQSLQHLRRELPGPRRRDRPRRRAQDGAEHRVQGDLRAEVRGVHRAPAAPQESHHPVYEPIRLFFPLLPEEQDAAHLLRGPAVEQLEPAHEPHGAELRGVPVCGRRRRGRALQAEQLLLRAAPDPREQQRRPESGQPAPAALSHDARQGQREHPRVAAGDPALAHGEEGR